MLSMGVRQSKAGGHLKTNNELKLELIAGEIMESGKSVTHYVKLANIPINEINMLRGHIMAVAAVREHRYRESLKRMGASQYLQGWRMWYTKLLDFRMDPKNDDKDFTMKGV